MNLDDLMANDTRTVLLNQNDHAKEFVFYPDGQTTGGEISVVMGPSTQAMVFNNRTIDDERRADGFASLSEIRAVISEILGPANIRDPRKGDRIERTTGVYAGTWYVDTIDPDDGDAVVLHLTKDQIHEDAGPDVHQDGG